MGIFENCLLVSDIDGTLLHDGVIPANNIQAVDFFQAEGGRFSVATGRNTAAAAFANEQTRANAPSITCNGAILYDFTASSILWQTALPEQAKPLVAAILDAFGDIGAEIHTAQRLYVVAHTAEIDEHVAYERISYLETRLQDVCGEPWTKVLFACARPARMEALIQFADGLRTEGCYFMRTADRYFELSSAQASKGKALLRLADAVGAQRDRLFAIGDYYNDIDLLKCASIGAAPQNAPQAVKAQADYITARCQAGAVADFIDYLKGRLA